MNIVKKIINWTFSSFFKTIGKLLAIIILILSIIIIFTKLDIKLNILSVNALQLDNATTIPDIPEGYSEFIYAHASYYNHSDIDGKRILLAWNNQINQFQPKYDRASNLYNDDVIKFDYIYKVSDKPNSVHIAKINVFILNEDKTEWIKPPNIKYITSININRTDSIYTTYKINEHFNSNNEIDHISQNPNINGGYNITFVANEGKIFEHYHQYEWLEFNDTYTVKVYEKKLNRLLRFMSFERDNDVEEGLYLDQDFTQEIDYNMEITEDMTIYVKWQSDKLADYINNYEFDNYTYNTDFKYLSISANDHTKNKIYIGFKYNFSNIEVYNYSEIRNEYETGAIACLSSIGKVGDYYYYQFDIDDLTYNQVIIIPKDNLTIDNGKQQINYYDFRVTKNAYISYSSRIESIEIKDTSGNIITTNVKDSYNYSQNILFKQNNDLFENFRNLTMNKNINILSIFSNFWNSIKNSNLYIYIYILISGSLIILIIKSANRS